VLTNFKESAILIFNFQFSHGTLGGVMARNEKHKNAHLFLHFTLQFVKEKFGLRVCVL
jgi:hypothetical protein